MVFSWNPPTAAPPNPAGQTLYSDSDNNIGIGTLYPGAKLEIYSTSSDSVLKLSRQSATSTLFKLGTDSTLIINNNNLDVLTLKDGNVGIGTTTPSSKLHVLGDDVVLKIQSVTPAVETTIFSGSSGGVNRSTIFTTGSMLSLGAGGSTRMSILSNGNVGIGMTDPSVALDVTGDIEYTGTITDVSDIRLKENIKPIDGALDKLLTLDGVSFNMIGDDRRNLGFIAQEVQKVFPEAISVMDGAGHLGLDYTQMIPPIIEGIKELKAENESLKARIELLEAKQ